MATASPAPLARGVAIGLAGGARAFLPVAAVTLRGHGPTRARPLCAALAVGELVWDKLPQATSRLDPPALMARATSSGLAGYALGGPPVAAAAALAGVGAAFGGFHARAALGRLSGWPDPLWAVVEDTVAITLATLATRPA